MLVLICLIVIAIVINRAIPCYFREKPVDISNYHAEIEHFKASLIPKEKQTKQTNYLPAEIPVELFSFDPNRLDSADFIRLGFPPYLASRILRYRSKGGVFRKPADFSKIYGMKEELYTKLLPYISIEKEMKSESVFSKNKKMEKIVASEKGKHPAPAIEIIELNSADTATLKKLKGIGTVYAERIVKYRNFLGGFYQVEQLKEVYGISDEVFQSLQPYLTVDNSGIKKIRLNREVNARLRHPYLKKEQLSALVLFLQKNQPVSTFETLKEINEFSNEDWERLIPYLSLD